ncbi:unnamed protein product [Oreochromis niloticus]|nr:unnamed protein product [Mustela putorius furo]
MQQHIAKCKKIPQGPTHAAARSSTQGENESVSAVSESDTHSSAPGPSGIRGFFNFMDDTSQKNADECFARAIYATGSPLMLTSNVYWKRFLNVLRPAYIPPTRHALSTHLLDEDFSRVQAKVKQTIDQADCISVISDGWSNIRGQGIINYIITTPQPVFYKSVDTKVSRGSFVSNNIHLVPVFCESSVHSFFIVFERIATALQWPQDMWCVMLLCKLTGKAQEVCSGLSMEDCLVYEKLKSAVLQAYELVPEAYRQHFRGLELAQGQSYLDFAREKEKLFDSLLEGKESLQEMAISQCVGIDSDIKKVILDDVLWERVSSSQKILKPIAAAIAKIEGDGAILSDVQCLFAELKEEIQTILPTSLLLKAEETAVVKSLEQRREFCMKPVHAAAYMLDPKYYDKGILSGEEINSAYVVITAMSDHLGLDKGKVLGSLAKYRTKQGLWKGDGIWQSCQHISVATWWKGLCESEALAPVASILLQIPPSSAASERNWSLFANTYTKVRNRLTNVRVEKLVGIRANLRLFEPDTEPSSTRLESDTEEEDSELDAEEVDMLLDDDEVQEESID